LIGNGFINKEDLNLFRTAKNVDEAVRYIGNFYKVYHSIRYVSGLTVLRLNREISGKALKHINQEFKDILTDGSIKRSPPTEKEVQEGEYPELPRIVMNFNMHDYGRLFKMIHFINRD
jgi:hypothetical protein